MMQTKYLYAAKFLHEERAVKIGKSINVSHRLGGLSKYYGDLDRDSLCVWAGNSQEIDYLEKILHLAFLQKNVKMKKDDGWTEFFDVSVQDIENEINKHDICSTRYPKLHAADLAKISKGKTGSIATRKISDSKILEKPPKGKLWGGLCPFMTRPCDLELVIKDINEVISRDHKTILNFFRGNPGVMNLEMVLRETQDVQWFIDKYEELDNPMVVISQRENLVKLRVMADDPKIDSFCGVLKRIIGQMNDLDKFSEIRSQMVDILQERDWICTVYIQYEYKLKKCLERMFGADQDAIYRCLFCFFFDLLATRVAIRTRLTDYIPSSIDELQNLRILNEAFEAGLRRIQLSMSAADFMSGSRLLPLRYIDQDDADYEYSLIRYNAHPRG